MSETTGPRADLRPAEMVMTAVTEKTEKNWIVIRSGQKRMHQSILMQFQTWLEQEGTGKGHRDRPRSHSAGPRSPRSDSKDGNGASKGRVLRGTRPSGEEKQFSCYSQLKDCARNSPVIVSTLPTLSSTIRRMAAGLVTLVRFFTQTTAKVITRRQNEIRDETTLSGDDTPVGVQISCQTETQHKPDWTTTEFSIKLETSRLALG